ncbi:hypothetical protein EDC40_103629 [Aminobacter aminovorans]|uniref:Uncharacterized protein n=1 Tax=Aminobacter aminovorans TaxID=83263 RepID=A0A380WKB5_AMIAI|nr:hypothetical protein [Aminobacter aminovorans]TCS28161.1 hypothetical protein EDC40_103629 [Aminobacter aminovorans]SUU89427.1 Uncharacterised protein [Aminobacter aminovorans]
MLQKVLTDYGVFTPGELDLIARVYEATLPSGATDEERESHASKLLRLFTTSGLKTEDELTAALRESLQP